MSSEIATRITGHEPLKEAADGRSAMSAHPHESDVDYRDDGRGRAAESPADIPARGWWDIAMRVRKEMAADNVDIIASGLALYALLAVFPALAAAVSVYGLFSSPAGI